MVFLQIEANLGSFVCSWKECPDDYDDPFLDIPFCRQRRGKFGAGNKPAARNTSDLFSVELDGLYGRQATVVSVKFVGSWN